MQGKVQSSSGYERASGNVVIGYTTDSHLCLDCDLKPEDEVTEFSEKYAEFNDLGSSDVWKTSDGKGQVDLFSKRLGNYCIIFGRILSWQKTKWHISEAYRLDMIHRNFLVMREIDKITIGVNPKNDQTPAPKHIHSFRNGDDRGTRRFLRWWKMNKEMGTKEDYHAYKMKCIQDCLRCPSFYTKQEGQACLDVFLKCARRLGAVA